MSKTTAMLIQGIKTIGKDQLTDKQIRTLSKNLTDKEKKELLKDGKTASAWAYEVLRKIAKQVGEKSDVRVESNISG